MGWANGSSVSLTNERAAEHRFRRLTGGDAYFPDRLVDEGRAILLRLCDGGSRPSARRTCRRGGTR